VKSTLEAAIQNAAPDATSIIVSESNSSLTASGFVSLTQLQTGLATVALSQARVPQVGG